MIPSRAFNTAAFSAHNCRDYPRISKALSHHSVLKNIKKESKDLSFGKGSEDEHDRKMSALGDRLGPSPLYVTEEVLDFCSNSKCFIRTGL